MPKPSWNRIRAQTLTVQAPDRCLTARFPLPAMPPTAIAVQGSDVARQADRLPPIPFRLEAVMTVRSSGAPVVPPIDPARDRLIRINLGRKA